MDNKVFIKCGFSKDENISQLTKFFYNDAKFKKIHIDIYTSNPFDKTVLPVLMLRRYEKDVVIENNGRSIVIKMNDKHNTYIAELLLETINDSYSKMNFENCFDFVLNCQNKFYKITIFK